MNPGKPIDKVEVGIAAAVGSVFGGAGGLAVAAVGSGTISVGRAVAIQTVVKAVAGGAGSAAESATKGQPITAEGVASHASRSPTSASTSGSRPLSACTPSRSTLTRTRLRTPVPLSAQKKCPLNAHQQTTES